MPQALAFQDLDGEVTLDNDRVTVLHFVVAAGRPIGRHVHRNPQLLIYIRGGRVAGADGPITIWTDGGVRWFAARDEPEDAGTNVGDTDIEIVVVDLKPVPAEAALPAGTVTALSYPNVTGEDVFENELVIVQRFVMPPGQWEGVHAHQPNMLFVHIRGGQWAARTYDSPAVVSSPSADGEPGWMDPVDLSVGHESGNVGTTPIDFVWVSLKQ